MEQNISELLELDHAKEAMGLFQEGYNCAQAVFLSFHDLYQLDFEVAARLSSSFGGGMGKLREVCGSVTGMFMVAGMLYGYDDPNANEEKTELYQRIQELAGRFKEFNHSIVCRDLLGLSAGKDTYVPELRTAEYYKKRPCKELVGLAAGLMEQFVEENPV